MTRHYNQIQETFNDREYGYGVYVSKKPYNELNSLYSVMYQGTEIIIAQVKASALPPPYTSDNDDPPVSVPLDVLLSPYFDNAETTFDPTGDLIRLSSLNDGNFVRNSTGALIQYCGAEDANRDLRLSHWRKEGDVEWKMPIVSKLHLIKFEREVDFDVHANDIIADSTRLLKCADAIADGLQSKLREHGFNAGEKGVTRIPPLTGKYNQPVTNLDEAIDQIYHLRVKHTEVTEVLLEVYEAIRSIAITVCSVADNHHEPGLRDKMDKHIATAYRKNQYIGLMLETIEEHSTNKDIEYDELIEIVQKKVHDQRIANGETP